MEVVIVGEEPARLRTHVPLRDESVTTGRTPDAVDPNQGAVVVCCLSSGTDIERTVSTLTADAAGVVGVTDDATRAATALDAGAITTVPDPDGDGSGDHLAAAIERVHTDRTERVTSPIAAALDAHPDVFFAFRPNGDLLEWNETLATVTGYDDDRIAEMTPTEFFQGETRSRVESAIGRVVVEGSTTVRAPLTTADGEHLPFEFTAVLADGIVVGSGRRLDDRVVVDSTDDAVLVDSTPSDSTDDAVLVDSTPFDSTDDRETGTAGLATRLYDAVIEAATTAETREGIERAVCDQLTREDLFRFAWIGEYDAETDRVERRAWAGDGSGYLPESAANGAALSVIRETAPIVDPRATADPDAGPFRATALREPEAAAAVPVATDETTYGCLCVYAGRAAAFDDPALFEPLGRLLGYAVENTEIRRSLVADTAVELQFRVTDSDAFIARAARHTEGRLELIEAVERPDGSIRQLFTVRGIPANRLETLATAAPVPVEVIADREEEAFLQATVGRDSLAHAISRVGGQIESITAADGDCRVRIRVPRNADVSAVMDAVRNVYDVQLLSKREVQREAAPDTTFRADVRQHLTDRQVDVIETAYRAGFFDWPREQTGDEVADLLDVSPPTFHQHRRIAVRKLLAVLFDTDHT